jgi:hypothetical protein
MARGIGTSLGISVVALALHFGARHGYAGQTQARPAFIVLAVACAAAAAIALASRTPGGAGRTRQGGGPARCRSLMERSRGNASGRSR